MKGSVSRDGDWTRRAILAGLAGSAFAADGQDPVTFPTEAVRYSDPATELPVLRLTDPAHASFLPTYSSHGVTRSGGSLVYASDRTGAWQAYRMDLKTGRSLQLTEAADLDPSTLCQLYDERGICYFDGPSLRQTVYSNLRTRDLYTVPEGWKRGQDLSISVDGLYATFVETRDRVCRLQLLPLAKPAATTILESQETITEPVPRPRRAGILYRGGTDALWLVNYDGQQNRRLRTAAGGLGPAHWSSDGRTVLYLSYPAEQRKLNEIREHAPDSNSDQLVAPTSQFVSFSPNGDASVFAGASSNKASPYVLILLRVTKRELTVCEHRSSDPASVAPLFSPDSQQVYFQSDRHGKPAIYSMGVDRLVEKTQT